MPVMLRILCSPSPLAAGDPESRLEDPGQVRKMLNSAARDCVTDDRSSIVAFQARTGVEVGV